MNGTDAHFNCNSDGSCHRIEGAGSVAFAAYQASFIILYGIIHSMCLYSIVMSCAAKDKAGVTVTTQVLTCVLFGSLLRLLSFATVWGDGTSDSVFDVTIRVGKDIFFVAAYSFTSFFICELVTYPKTAIVRNKRLVVPLYLSILTFSVIRVLAGIGGTTTVSGLEISHLSFFFLLWVFTGVYSLKFLSVVREQILKIKSKDHLLKDKAVSLEYNFAKFIIITNVCIMLFAGVNLYRRLNKKNLTLKCIDVTQECAVFTSGTYSHHDYRYIYALCAANDDRFKVTVYDTACSDGLYFGLKVLEKVFELCMMFFITVALFYQPTNQQRAEGPAAATTNVSNASTGSIELGSSRTYTGDTKV